LNNRTIERKNNKTVEFWSFLIQNAIVQMFLIHWDSNILCWSAGADLQSVPARGICIIWRGLQIRASWGICIIWRGLQIRASKTNYY